MRRAAEETAESLIEVLITVVIVGIAVTSLMFALGSVTMASATHRSSSSIDTVLRSGAEALKDRGLPYAPCANAAAYSSALTAVSGSVAWSYTVKYWLGATTTDAGGRKTPTFGVACTPATDRGLQEIVLTASNGDISRTVTAIKRRV